MISVTEPKKDSWCIGMVSHARCVNCRTHDSGCDNYWSITSHLWRSCVAIGGQQMGVELHAKKVIQRLLRDSLPSCFPNPVAAMATQHPRRLPEFKFRVLIIGRANAGKTSILQRVCDTTESPVIYRRKDFRQEQVHLSFVISASLVSPPDQIQLDPSMEVSGIEPFIGYY
jgi:hypothetical protein